MFRLDSDAAECSDFLRTMELEDSDEEEEVENEEEMLSLKEVGTVEEMQVDHQETQSMEDEETQMNKKDKWDQS